MKVLLLLAALLLGAPAAAAPASAIFAGGCFWCVEADLEKLPGVLSVESGYSGGTLAQPRYAQVSAGGTGHFEVVRVTYDPARLSYAALLGHFWRQVDPDDAGGQFCDRGEQYRSAIFVANAAERAAAEASRQAVARQLGRAVVTPILPAGTFWPAEAEHQDYARRNPLRYRYYRSSCGRDARLRQVWGAR